MSVPDTLSAVTEEDSAVPLSFLLWLQDLVAIAAGGGLLMKVFLCLRKNVFIFSLNIRKFIFAFLYYINLKCIS